MVLEMPTRSKRQEALEKLPTSLYDSFQGMITRIRESPNASYAELGIRVLMWLCFARRPLKLAELQHAVAVERNHTEFEAGNIPSLKVLLDCCLGLVVLDKETSTVRFVHYTLEEYFRQYAEFPTGYSYIAETCLIYLSFGELRQYCTSLKSLREKMKKYALLNYAALYWGTYIKQQSNDSLTKLAHIILDHDSDRPPCAIQALYLELDNFNSGLTQKFSGIHAAAYFGLSENMAYFCSVGRHIELKDESDRTPLSWAAGYGHEAVVQLLIERGDIDINAKDEDGWTPLMSAAKNGHEAVVQLLIERDNCDIHAEDKDGWTPLIWAAKNGYEAVVRLLIERDDININAKDEDEWTTWAAENGHEAVVWPLIERGDIDIDAKGEDGWTPLMSRPGHETKCPGTLSRDYETRRHALRLRSNYPGTSRDFCENLQRRDKVL